MGSPTYGDYCAARFNDDGSVDTTFGSAGVVRTNFAAINGTDIAWGVASLADGRLVIGGVCGYAATADDYCISAYSNGGTMQQYVGGSSDWSTSNTSLFGACLHTTASATATWTVSGTCPTTNGAYWNAVPSTPSTIASAASGVSNASVGLRFGLRTAPSQPPGAYVAPVSFTVVAP
jgi:hypothetical protein